MLKKKVNGVPIEMTDEEEAAFLAQQALDSAPPTNQELEAEVQAVADEITQNSERDFAIALTTVDLVIAARDGGLNGLSRAEIRSLFRDRVVSYLRQRRGL